MPIRVLLAQSDRSGYELVRRSLADVRDTTYELDWVQSREAAGEALRRYAHDVALIDHEMIDGPGLDVLRDVAAPGRRAAVILVTRNGAPGAEQIAGALGADECFAQEHLRPEALQRCIRGAIDRRRLAIEGQRSSSAQLEYITRMRDAHIEIDSQRQRVVSLARQMAAAKNFRERPISASGSAQFAPVGRWCFDSTGRTTRADAETWRIFEVENSAEIAARSMEDLAGPEGAAQIRAALADLQPGCEIIEELALLGQRTGRRSLVVMSVQRTDADEPRYAASLVDITDAGDGEDSRLTLARFDCMTGLHNRASFDESLRQEIARANRAVDSFALLRIDLNGFEGVGKRHYVDLDDRVGPEIGRRIRAGIRSSDIAARLGGEAFAVLAPGARNNKELAVLAERLQAQLAAPLHVAGRVLDFDIGIGIVLYPNDGRYGDQLLERAELALHRPRRSPSHNWQFHDDGMQDRAVRQSMVTDQLARALERGAFSFAMEPVVTVPQARVCAMEALIRWHLPDGRTLRAGEFIPSAESSGRITALGAWSLPAACLMFAKSVVRRPDMALVLNISPAELNAVGFPALIDRVLADGTIAPGQLRLDIAAQRGLAEQPAFVRRLSEIRERGIHLAFDGFTGDEVSLAQFRNLPFHQIKLHEEIFSKALVSPADKDYLRAVNGYCQSVGMSVAAKGVETEQHLALALEVGCAEIQGRLLNLPTPDNGARQWAAE